MPNLKISELSPQAKREFVMLVKDVVLEGDVITKRHLDLLKKISAAWEVAPEWSFAQLVNYLLNFCSPGELYNVTDKEIIETCDGIVEEKDRLATIAFYTKPLLISKLRPQTCEQYLQAARDILTMEEYGQIMDSILCHDYYERLPPDLRVIVDSYYAFDK